MNPLRNELQQLILTANGWHEWRDDPWGSYPLFIEWWIKAGDNALTLHTVNETSGRWYLAHSLISDRTRHEDLEALPAKEVVQRLLTSINMNLWVNNMVVWDRFEFPKLSFPVEFIAYVIGLNEEQPFTPFLSILATVYGGDLALKAKHIDEEHTGLAGLIALTLRNSPRSEHLLRLYHQLAPDMPLPSADGWDQLNIEGPLSGSAARFEHGFGSREDAMQQAKTEALGIIAKEMYEDPERLIEVGLRDKLPGYLGKSVSYAMLRKTEAASRRADKELSESEFGKPLDSVAFDDQHGDGEKVDDIRLEDLGLSLIDLTPAEGKVLESFKQATDQGYYQDSKTGKSLRDWWGPDYERHSRTWRRARKKLKRK